MSQLSRYIQKQLVTILNKIQEAPPRRCASMNKIKTLICKAPLTNEQKQNINKSIQKIQNVMIQSSFKKKNNRNPIKSQYVKNLFYENMFLQEKNLNKTKKKEQESQVDNDNNIQYTYLLLQLQQIRSTRLKRQEFLNQLILKTQRMQRLINLKKQNQQKYLKSKMLAEEQQMKKTTQQNIKKQIKQAIKSNQIKAVNNIISKHNNFIK